MSITSTMFARTLVCCVVILGAYRGIAAERDNTPDEMDRVRRALIVAGLPGDEEHRQQFLSIRESWIRWF